MKIRDVVLEDFRSFYEKHTIEFSTDGEKHITILVGENGSGKTTLLNAIFWAFTDRFTKQLTKSSNESANVVNKDALKEGRRECSVQVTFIDESGGTYLLNRSYSVATRTSTLSLHSVSKEGVSRPIPPNLAQGHIEKFLPAQLANWFIFDGEAIDQIKLNGSSEFKKDLQKTFGFSHMALLIEQLRLMERDYARQESKAINDDDVRQANDLVEKYEIEIAKYDQDILELETKIETEEKLEEDYFQQLRALPQSEAVAGKLAREKRLLAENKTIKARQEAKRIQLLTEDAPKIVISDLCKDLEGKFEVKEIQQSLPSPFGTQLISDIFAMKKCICGRAVHEGSEEAEHLVKLTERASTSQINQRIAIIRGSIAAFGLASSRYHESMEEHDSGIVRLEQEIHEHSVAIDKYESELAGIPVETIRDLDARWQQARKNGHSAREALGVQKARNSSVKNLHSNAKVSLDQLLVKKSRGSQIFKERQEIAELLEYVVKQFARQEAEVLSAISSELSIVMTKYFTKHYSAVFDNESYSVKTYDQDKREVSLSTGEGYVLKFAVIASIVGLAASKSRNSHVNWISSPIVAPLIFDAPFSVNDSTYRKNIANNLSDQASQLVMLFDSDKWNAGMSSDLSNKVGKFYTLISRASGTAKEISKSMQLGKRNIILNEYDCERDESICVEQKL